MVTKFYKTTSDEALESWLKADVAICIEKDDKVLVVCQKTIKKKCR